MSAPPSIEVRVTRYFEAAPERVFDAWLVPRTLGQWMFGPRVRDENVVRLDVDPRVGGSFSLKVERHGELVDHIGQYLQIERPHRLAFTSAVRDDSDDAPSEVHIEISPSASGCVLVLVHRMDPKWSDYADRSRDAWDTMLDALASLFA